MSWIGLALLVVGVYFALRLVGALLKILMFVVALVGAYWIAAPHMGWPTVSELVYVLGPDFGGRRIEEVVVPSAIADGVADRVVDEVVERAFTPPASAVEAVEPLPAQGAGEVEPAPEPVPEPEPVGEQR